VKIEVSEAILEEVVRQRRSGQGLVERAEIILGAAGGQTNAALGRQYQQHRDMVHKWRQRWAEAQESLAAVEAAQDKDQPLSKAIEQVLSDAWRSGRPDRFSAEEVVQIVAISCEDPAASGLPITQWTPKDIAQEAIRRGIVQQISPQSVGRFLKRGGSATVSGQVLAQG
jgi:putative transposase